MGRKYKIRDRIKNPQTKKDITTYLTWAYDLLGAWWAAVLFVTIGGLMAGASGVLYLLSIVVGTIVITAVRYNATFKSNWSGLKDHVAAWWSNRPGNDKHEIHDPEGT